MNFDTAVQIVIMKEGGLVDNPNDNGSLTKYGISSRAFPKEDVVNLTLERAKQLYKKHYWNMVVCDSLPPWLRLIVFDCAVNQGPTRAIIFLQKLLRVPADGVLGPKTIAPLSAVSPKEFLSEYTMKRFDAYSNHPQWHIFGKGWMDRLFYISLIAMRAAPDEVKVVHS